MELLTWKINNGRKVDFWVASWNGHKPLKEIDGIEGHIEWLHNTYYWRVENYMQRPNSQIEDNFEWINILTFSMPQGVKSTLRMILDLRKIYIIHGEGEIIYYGSKIGEYPLKIGYFIQRAQSKLNECDMKI